MGHIRSFVVDFAVADAVDTVRAFFWWASEKEHGRSVGKTECDVLRI